MNNLLDTAFLLSAITSFVIPLISALLSRQKVSTFTGLATLALSSLSGFLAEWAAQPHDFDWKKGALASVVAFIVAVASHYGIWKSTPTEAALLAFPKPQGTVRQAA